MPSGRKILKAILYGLAGILVILLCGFGYLVWVSKVNPPDISDKSSLQLVRQNPGPEFYTLKNSWLRKSKSGLYEMYVEGAPFERGVINGKLSSELVKQQEDYFNDQILKIIPSKSYLHFLKYFVGWFNRNLDKNVTAEYKEEIYGISASASDKYDYIGSNYQRILNYHAAHDIGHALQNLALVGCTSFGTWDSKSADNTMIIGRNFDFYVGDRFADNKIVAFVNPSEGFKFMTVTWAGFIGVVSGMNEKGLTVTINAAKSSVPSASATPVSLVAREILQYSKNIAEAIVIARKRKMFVSESFLVASAEDHKAVVIEKTPDSLDIYDPHQQFIVCANHFQSKGLSQTVANLQQVSESASMYRYQRLLELLNANGKNTVQKTVDILRDRKGLENADIGMGNEKAINQLIAHHSIVFEPEKRLVWISTAPWQLGEYIAYDLNKVFSLAGMKQDKEINDSALTIAADPFLKTPEYIQFTRFRKYKQAIFNGESVDADSIIASNPEFYQSYILAGDVSSGLGRNEQAIVYYQLALRKVIATKKEEDYVRKRILALADDAKQDDSKQ